MSEIKTFLEQSVNASVDLDEQVDFLKKYTPDKVTAADLSEFYDFMKGQMAGELNMPGAIDVCGTGGSGLPRINTSTIASFILADLGVGVAKHGNKAASGRFGSFDLLEKLGVNIEKGPSELEEIYAKEGLAFIFARMFHPAMRFFAEARGEVGRPTVFNLLGPLLNPAGVSRQVIGTAFGDQMLLIAEACDLIGKERVMIVRGEDGLDEVTLSGKTRVVELSEGGEISDYEISPEDFGLKPCEFDEIAGGDEAFNTQIAEEILRGESRSRHADLVYVNCALALKLAGKTDDLREGYEMARKADGYSKLTAYKNA